MALTKPAGAWTYDDLLSLPEDGKRYEIIEGELYEMPAPNLVHATIVINLIGLLLPIVAQLRGQLYTAPVDLFFHGADPVQPDILVLLQDWRGRRARRGPEGAPHLVIEVLSPANRVHDVLTKRALYGRAGVREYGIVDPEARSIEVLMHAHDAWRGSLTDSQEESFSSSVLGGARISLAPLFTGLDRIEDDVE